MNALLLSIAALVSSTPAFEGTAILPQTDEQNGISYSVVQNRKSAIRLENGDNTETTPVTEAPEGETKLYTRESYGFSGYGTRVFFGTINLQPVKVVYTESGDAYIYNPYSKLNTSSYLKGSCDGNKITVTLPQPVYQQEVWDKPGELQTYYATLMNVMKNDEGQIGVTPSDKNEVTFSITDGKISLDLGYEYATDEEGNSVMPETILAMVDSEGNWYCYGDCYQLSKPFNCEATVAPDDLKTEKWAMTWQDKGKFVNVGFRNDDVYIQGFDDNFPEAWIKGSKEGNAYRFKSGQYLGEIPYYVYLTFCASESDPNDETMLYMRDYTDFIFNENEHSLAPSPETVLIANAAADEYVSWYTYYESPMIRKQPDNINQTPLRPEFWGHVDCFEDYGYNNFSVYLYYFNNQYYLLDPANLYYEVKFDDDVVEFTKEEYYMTENITRVPFALTDGAISADGTYHIISYYKPAPEYISVQLFNVVDGETYASDIMTFDPARNMDVSGVNAPSEFHEVKKTEWFTLDGIRTDRPEKGIYIRVMTFSDGSRQTDKIVRR